MLICPKCKSEYREGYKFCSDCRCELIKYENNETDNTLIGLTKTNKFKIGSNHRLGALCYFGLAIIVLQYLFTRYAVKNNDSFGIMLAFYTLLDITLFPALATIGIACITLFKRDYNSCFCIDESLLVWKIISIFVGVIPVITFGDRQKIISSENIFIFIIFIGVNLLTAIIGGIILNNYVHRKAELK